jgi:hypothetical protein
MAGDNNCDSDSDSSYVLLSDATSVGSDSENFVIVAKDSYRSTDSDEDLFGESQNESEKVMGEDITDSEEDPFCESQQQLEKNGDDDNNVNTDSDEGRHQLKKLVDYSSTDSDEDPGVYGGPMNRSYVAYNEVCYCFIYERCFFISITLVSA